MRSTQVAAAWVPSLFQGLELQPPSRHKFIKLLISNNVSSVAPLSPAATSSNLSQRVGAAPPPKSDSAESDESSSGDTDSGSAFSSPEAARPVPHPHTGKQDALPLASAGKSLTMPVGDGVQEMLKECRSVMQVRNSLALPFTQSLIHVPRHSRHFVQAFLESNRDLELKMSQMQSSQTASSPVASGLADLRRELDESNQERVQVGFPCLSHHNFVFVTESSPSSRETLAC